MLWHFEKAKKQAEPYQEESGIGRVKGFTRLLTNTFLTMFMQSG